MCFRLVACAVDLSEKKRVEKLRSSCGFDQHYSSSRSTFRTTARSMGISETSTMSQMGTNFSSQYASDSQRQITEKSRMSQSDGFQRKQKNPECTPTLCRTSDQKIEPKARPRFVLNNVSPLHHPESHAPEEVKSEQKNPRVQTIKLLDSKFLRDVQRTSRKVHEDLDNVLRSLRGSVSESADTDSRTSTPLSCRVTLDQIDSLRNALIDASGSAWNAYNRLDCNNTNCLCEAEFFECLDEMGLNWADITASTKSEVFSLLDPEATGYLNLVDLFPHQAQLMECARQLTPGEFWSKWCDAKHRVIPKPHWGLSPGIGVDFATLEKIRERRQWIQEMFPRLKGVGKSDSSVRRMVCSHLPKGSGPPDLDNVQTFGEDDLLLCQKTYADDIKKPIRKIHAYVYDLQNQRRQLTETRRALFNLTERQRLDEEEAQKKVDVAKKFLKSSSFHAGSYGDNVEVPDVF